MRASLLLWVAVASTAAPAALADAAPPAGSRQMAPPQEARAKEPAPASRLAAPGPATPRGASDKRLGRSCGSRGQSTCGRGNFCDFPESAGCGDTDRPGVCAKKPKGCPKDFRPVCGCDSRTYPNACQANAKGASVRAPGTCAEEAEAEETAAPAPARPKSLCGECPAGTRCKLVQVQCIRAPCPPIPECVATEQR